MGLPPHWWTGCGDFLDPLFAATAGESGGESGSTGWVWLSEHESREAARRIREAAESDEPRFSAWLLEDAHDACREPLCRAVPLATRGELRADRHMNKLHTPTLFGDPARPEQIFLALDESAPPPLWIPAGTTAASLERAFSPYAWPERDAPLPDVTGLPASVRLFLGTEEEMGGGLDAIAHYFRSLPGTDSLPWGTRYAQDPWPARPVGIELVRIGYRMEETLGQVEGAVPAVTMRSRRLGAALSFSSLEGFVVLEARYAPVAHESILPGLEAILPGLPRGLPPDMPVDLLSVVARCRGLQAPELRALVRDPAEARALGYHALALLATLGDDGASTRALLEELSSRPDPAARSLGYKLASIARHKRFLHEALLRETDAETLEALKKFLSP